MLPLQRGMKGRQALGECINHRHVHMAGFLTIGVSTECDSLIFHILCGWQNHFAAQSNISADSFPKDGRVSLWLAASIVGHFLLANRLPFLYNQKNNYAWRNMGMTSLCAYALIRRSGPEADRADHHPRRPQARARKKMTSLTALS